MYLEDRTVSLFPVLQMFRDSHVLGDFVVLIYFFMAWWFCDQDTVPSGQSVYSLSAYSFNLSLLRLLPTPPSISHPIFWNENALLDQKKRDGDKWRVIIYLFPLQAQTACFLWWSFSTCMPYALSVSLIFSPSVFLYLVLFRFVLATLT